MLTYTSLFLFLDLDDAKKRGHPSSQMPQQPTDQTFCLGEAANQKKDG